MFDPLSIPWHTAFWASDPSWSNPGDGNAVSSWRDASGNSRTATQATGSKQPIYHAADLGGKPCVTFDGVDDFLQTASFTAIGQPATLAVVAQLLTVRSAGPGLNQLIQDGISTSARVIICGQAFTSPNVLWEMFSGTVLTAGTPDTNPHVFIGDFESAANDTLRLDGTVIVNSEAGAQSLTGVTLGARFDGTLVQANVRIAFYGHITRALTTAERAAFDSWAKQFYGITVSDYTASSSPENRLSRRNSLLRR